MFLLHYAGECTQKWLGVSQSRGATVLPSFPWPDRCHRSHNIAEEYPRIAYLHRRNKSSTFILIFVFYIFKHHFCTKGVLITIVFTFIFTFFLFVFFYQFLKSFTSLEISSGICICISVFLDLKRKTRTWTGIRTRYLACRSTIWAIRVQLIVQV